MVTTRKRAAEEAGLDSNTPTGSPSPSATPPESEMSITEDDHTDDDTNDDTSQNNSPEPNIRGRLDRCLSSVQYVGSYATYRSTQTIVDPGLSVHGIGNVRLPISIGDAEAIMKISAQAPFGRGTTTIVDRSVRDTKELNPDQFELRNPAWTEYLNGIVTELGKNLGYPDSPAGIEAQLYKMLLYEKGAMFKAHKDSEKAAGMFATLIICLPSLHRGGATKLNHRGETCSFETATASEFGHSHVAWYSDVVHEIEPIESGYRLVLTYNLVRTGYLGPPSAAIMESEKDKLRAILSEWDQGEIGNQFRSRAPLAYILDHKYTEANLDLSRLKGRDAQVGRYIEQVCEEKDFMFFLANLKRTIFDMGENYEEGEDLNQNFDLTHIIDTSGDTFLDEAQLQEEAIIQRGYFDRYPDKIESEDTGNYGVVETHFYRDSVLLLLPRKHEYHYRLSFLDESRVNAWIEKLAAQITPSQDTDRYREALRNICLQEARFCSSGGSKTTVRTGIEACLTMQDFQLLHKMVSRITSEDTKFKQWHLPAQSLGKALRTHQFKDIEPSLNTLLHNQQSFACKVAIADNVTSAYDKASDMKSDPKTLSKLEAWEKSARQKGVKETSKLEPTDAESLVRTISCLSKDFIIKNLVPLLEEHATEMTLSIPFLARLFEATPESVKTATATQILTSLINLAVGGLSQSSIYTSSWVYSPKDQDFWTSDRDSSLAPQLARVYYECLANHPKDALGIQQFLHHRAEHGEVRFFSQIVLPFLRALEDLRQTNGAVFTPEQQNMFAVLVTLFQTRCIHIEPAAPTDWARDPKTQSHGCIKSPKNECNFCNRIKAFSPDAEVESINFDQAEGESHKWSLKYCEGEVIKIGDREFFKVTKTKKEHEKLHGEWAERVASVETKMPKYKLSKELLGERFGEVMGMKIVRLEKKGGE